MIDDTLYYIQLKTNQCLIVISLESLKSWLCMEGSGCSFMTPHTDALNYKNMHKMRQLGGQPTYQCQYEPHLLLQYPKFSQHYLVRFFVEKTRPLCDLGTNWIE
jgi:hypothetical protein